MAQELKPWQPPPTTSSLEQKIAQSQATIAYATSAVDGLKAAKKLVGQWAHLKVDQPDIFVASIGAVLSQYPLGLVEECVDPRCGAAKKLKFLSIADLTAWLDDRLAVHRALARHSIAPQLPAPTFTEEHCATMRQRVAEVFHNLWKHRQINDPVDQLRRRHQTQGEPTCP